MTIQTIQTIAKTGTQAAVAQRFDASSSDDKVKLLIALVAANRIPIALDLYCHTKLEPVRVAMLNGLTKTPSQFRKFVDARKAIMAH